MSESKLEVAKGRGEGGRDAAMFAGVVREENNGGFASVRSKNFAAPLDVSDYEGEPYRLSVLYLVAIE